MEWTMVNNNIQKDGAMAVTLKVIINCRGGRRKNNAIVLPKCRRVHRRALAGRVLWR